MKIYDLDELIKWARDKSPFYKDLYQQLGTRPQLEDLPVLESASFWSANGVEKNRVLTSGHEDGIVFKSGGTTGNPKYSFLTKEEWFTFTEAFGDGMTRGGLVRGEKVANLFYAGDLYASFLFIMKSLEASKVPVLHLPLGGAAETVHILKTLSEFKVDVWAGVPTTIMKLAEQVHDKKNDLKIPSPKKILFGGESFYSDQRVHLQKIFPDVRIQSIGYASVDGGLLGFADSTCAAGEHRVFSDHTIIEILDQDTGQSIHEPGQPGKVILTNLTRKLMPILRYPAGDLAEWVDPKTVLKFRKFKILGRSEEGARIGPVTLYYDDLAQFLQKYRDQLKSSGFQVVIKHFAQKDQLIIRIASQKGSLELKAKIEKDLGKDRPLLEESVSQGLIHPLQIEFVEAHELMIQPRTGKLRRLIDERH